MTDTADPVAPLTLLAASDFEAWLTNRAETALAGSRAGGAPEGSPARGRVEPTAALERGRDRHLAGRLPGGLCSARCTRMSLFAMLTLTSAEAFREP